MTRMSRLLVLAVAVVLSASACGGKDAFVAPPAVEKTLAPAKLLEDLDLYENIDKRTVRAFANAGENTLVADGKIWEIRRADRLIGTLQISTVVPRVDLTDRRERDAIVQQIVSGEVERLRINDVEVYSTIVNDKATFLWFGLDLLEVVQLKDKALDERYEEVATQIIGHQATVSAWKPLPLEAVDAEAG
ncbi:MAG: hypothetical protein QOI61_2185 [Actinomycetota bacterium]|jgi:hypothetical protein